MKKQYVVTISNLEYEVSFLFNEIPCMLAIYDTLKRVSRHTDASVSYAALPLMKDLKTITLEEGLRDLGKSVFYGDTVIMMSEVFCLEDDE
jgi:hypothetical protein